ncbi:uncharacterized protein LOC142356279, partial [Convolutriloba macropyga]|uniref:uncharacterized protein LOC142356279 n=1 Tax=Convolutriloba macropyga TaxID=536237 RepID=UPI003F52046A
MKTLFVEILLIHFSGGNVDMLDITLERALHGRTRMRWESLQFIIPLPFSPNSALCENISPHFCLDKFLTIYDDDPVNLTLNGSLFERFATLDYTTLPSLTGRSIDVLLMLAYQRIVRFPIYNHYNLLSKVLGEACCRGQMKDYLVYGYESRNMFPSVYFNKLTNFSDDTLPLNYIE